MTTKFGTRQDRSGKQTLRALSAAARLYGDERFQELTIETCKLIDKAAFDAVMRFQDAGYSIADMSCALSYALTKLLVRVERDIDITPEDLGRMTAEALVAERKTEERKARK